MRSFGLGFLASCLLSFASDAQAGRIADGPSSVPFTAPGISVELNQNIALGNLISPSMQWSQLEIDNLKAEGLTSGLPYAYTAELAVKSDLIHSFKVTEIEPVVATKDPQTHRPLVGILMLTAAFSMWFGLSLQRKY